ncbi:MAG: DUF3244 domain-containing protein [Bacteroidales bacterium]|nr:DUF3244 domain-containing protein [Bacteroidales bacterium]
MAQEATYRPIIEEGKVWKVGEIHVANPVYETSCLHYYYFDGDTIIGGVKCKKMMCHDVAKYPLSDGTLEATCYVGAMYEQQKKVYIFKPDETEPLLLYDFGLEPSETEYVANGGYHSGVREIKVTSKEYVNNANYKGNYLAWTLFDSYREEWDENNLYGWMEGVGFIVEPIYNGVEEMISPRIMNLMSCTVGDEVIYYNPDIIDGVNPLDEETKKRIDFTHVVKPRPKAPHQKAEADGDQLNGAYTLRLLDLDLGTMSDTYHVTITDDTGNVVYQKTVRAADVLSLNINISEWAAPSYTINVENDYEQYIGTFELTPTDIEEVKSEELKVKTNAVYDLTGRRLTCEPKKGMYIKDGRKYLKR